MYFALPQSLKVSRRESKVWFSTWGPRGLAVSFLSVCEGVNGREKGSVLMGFFPRAKPSRPRE